RLVAGKDALGHVVGGWCGMPEGLRGKDADGVDAPWAIRTGSPAIAPRAPFHGDDLVGVTGGPDVREGRRRAHPGKARCLVGSSGGPAAARCLPRTADAAARPLPSRRDSSALPDTRRAG